MDPDATLQVIRDLSQKILISSDQATPDTGALAHERVSEMIFDAIRLAEHCEALDGWITRGGHLPHRWGGLTARQVRYV